MVFGLNILFALLACGLVVWMGWPKTASFSVVLLWFIVAVTMFLGTGGWAGGRLAGWLAGWHRLV